MSISNKIIIIPILTLTGLGVYFLTYNLLLVGIVGALSYILTSLYLRKEDGNRNSTEEIREGRFVCLMCKGKFDNYDVIYDLKTNIEYLACPLCGREVGEKEKLEEQTQPPKIQLKEMMTEESKSEDKLKELGYELAKAIYNVSKGRMTEEEFNKVQDRIVNEISEIKL